MPAPEISSEVVVGSPEFPPADARVVTTVIEFDAPRCTLTYGEAPCTAELGITGDRKCYNTRRTCQDLPNFAPELFTYRFTRPSAQIHRDAGNDIIPSVTGVRVTPQLLNPGVDLGQRESVSVTFEDHPHSDAGLDPYLADRDFDPYAQGTFWGRFRARYTSLRGLPLRVYRGRLGDPFEEWETWHYVIESAALTGSSFQITGKDHLKLLDGDRAQAPAISLGELLAPVLAGAGSLTLTPAGIGDADYPASGKAAIGGDEIVSFTRAGDVVTLTARGLHGTEDQDHEEGDRFQLVLEYVSEPVEAIIYDLLTTYAPGFDASWIDLPAWETEVGSVVDQLYTAVIADPEDVSVLVNELIAQAGLVLWLDVAALQVRLTALRPVTSTAETVDENRQRAGTFRSTEQPKKRVSEVWTYYNQKNPLEPLDEPRNYGSAVVSFDENADPEEPPSIKKVFSRWIGFGNRAAALRFNGLTLSRYSTPPRLFAFALFYGDDLPELGRGAQVSHPSLQDETGARTARPVQVVSVENTQDGTNIQAEEMLFAPNDDLAGVRLIVIDADTLDVDLRELHDTFYTEPEPYTEVRCIIESATTVGSSSSSTPAFDVGEWPEFVAIEVIIRGAIRGAGGAGGNGGRAELIAGLPMTTVAPTEGGLGGPGLYTRYPITVENLGTIAGGGGGGGGGMELDAQGAGGGGGAGRVGGLGGVVAGSSGTDTAGGQGGGTMSDGGPPGTAGEAGNDLGPGALGAPGGDPGAAVDGESFITYTTEGTITGPRIN